MFEATSIKYDLVFKKPSGTSRGILYKKPSWFIKIYKKNNFEVFGIGECGPIDGLSVDNISEISGKLNEVTSNINEYKQIDITRFPSIKFGLETAFKDLKNNGTRTIFKNGFSKGLKSIKINGLIWMGDPISMKNQITDKLNLGFSCLKLKIGALKFEDELNIIKSIRSEFNKNDLEIRVDANGAFKYDSAMEKLDKLHKLDLHSIEQPIEVNQFEKMRYLCEKSPLPIALDEELIKPRTKEEKIQLINFLKPHFLVLKPSLLGGFNETKQWINIAEKQKIKWWITSALESNIGLNAIAQYCCEFDLNMPQGLGTGNIYNNNIGSPLALKNDYLSYNINKGWSLNNIFQS